MPHDSQLEFSLEHAQRLDREDPLRSFRDRFHFPRSDRGEKLLYLNGNSLGLCPKRAAACVQEDLDVWARHGINGYFHGEKPWIDYAARIVDPLLDIVGATRQEVVCMNALTVNLHLMLTSFYRPTDQRYKIVVESDAFSSDRYAVASHLALHACLEDALVEVGPRAGECTIRNADIVSRIEEEGDSIALILLGHPNYLTGQAFDIPSIVDVARKKGCLVGLDLAHGVGNLPLHLHDWDVDFAVWCSYKYLNAGPGAIAGCFIHERHLDGDRPRLAGWWGNDLATRFHLSPDFRPTSGAQGWQVSNPPVLQIAALRASLEVFASTSMADLRWKSEKLTAYLISLLKAVPDVSFKLVTPEEPAARGCQLSLQFEGDVPQMLRRLKNAGVVCDFREPDIIRVAPVPLYNSFEDVYRFAVVLRESLDCTNAPSGGEHGSR